MFVRRRRRPRAALARAVAAPAAPRPAPPGRPTRTPKVISWTALALLTVGSVGYLGSAPALSVFGLASVFLYVLPAFVFLVPVSLVAAELASGWPGGVYNWVREGISAPMGLLAVWCQFAQTIFYYPALLAYVAGVEVNAVHVNELQNPGREYPRSIFLAMGLVLAVFIGPTLAISWVVPASQISLTTGVMQAFNSLFTHFGLEFGVPLIAIALAVGALAGMITWLDGPSEGLLLIGREQGFLPPYFQKVDSHGIEVRIIAAQGAVITLIALLYAFIPTVSHAYWIFAVMATQVYLVMYVLMFVAAIRLRRSEPDHPRGYRAPALGLLCLLGTVSSVSALVIGFIPPAQFGHLNPVTYAVLILAGLLAIGILPPLLMDRLRKPGWKAAGDGSE